jgi:CheY-like chemotaxis protein
MREVRSAVPNRHIRARLWRSPFGILKRIAARAPPEPCVDTSSRLIDDEKTSSVLVCLVEDDLLAQDLLRGALEKEGYEVAVASTGGEAIALLDRVRKKLGALITDVELLPGTLTGWDVGRHARELFPKLPVIYITGACGRDWRSKGVPTSVLLEKPFASAKFLTAVSRLLAAGSPDKTGARYNNTLQGL